MNNSINHVDDSNGIDLISFDLKNDGREVAFTSCFDEEKQYEINSFGSSISNFNYEESKSYTNLKAYKLVDKLRISVGEILSYKVIIDNLSGIPVYNIILQDNLPSGTTYIINSLKLNGYIQGGAYPQLGFLIPKINGDSRVIITFEVSINIAEPMPKTIGNFSTVIINEKESINTNNVSTEIEVLSCNEDYEDNIQWNGNHTIEQEFSGYERKKKRFREYETNENRGLDLSNYCEEVLREAEEEKYLSLNIFKIANKEYVEFNDIITYKINVINNEKVNLFSIKLFEDIHYSLEFVKGTLIFNGQKINIDILDSLLNIGDLQPLQECNIEYKMRVKSTSKDGWIRSGIYAKCLYSLNQEDLIEGESKVFTSKTKVKAMNFKVVSLNKLVDLEECSRGSVSVEDIDMEVIVDEQYVFEGICFRGHDGNILSGCQLKFFGHIDALVQYAVMNLDAEIRLKTWSIPFTSQIILSPDYEEGDSVEIFHNIEYSVVDILNPSEINLGASILFYT
ncbi:DUF11 domain-containing protein [uncultured Clostridium sp.]|jgi:uncharacterized repeat protein (TIGR01451 family)|uniref:DUF11 domain-containing protein n=1 Tax=uncultured Clostridium sp. TaxID=59620 RepID=UPI00260F3E01|nr:DUF11 domain-containing protein [uncultured Clostridium sp.]